MAIFKLLLNGPKVIQHTPENVYNLSKDDF